MSKDDEITYLDTIWLDLYRKEKEKERPVLVGKKECL